MFKKSVNAFLNFNGRCEEAVEFYKTALGAEVDAMQRFQDAPPSEECESQQGGCSSGETEGGCMSPTKIMHASFRIGETMIMASDCRCTGKPVFEGVSLALSVGTEADADECFAALAEGGEVEMPLGKTFWSPRFGVVNDKFGVSWMINTMPAEGAGQPASA